MSVDLLSFMQAGGFALRRYQEGVARAVVDAALNGRGMSFAVMFPRQSGKNEVQAQIEAYLLWTLRDEDAELVKVSPTWRPQSINAMHRLVRALRRNPLTMNVWEKECGYIVRVGRARITFLSGAPESNIVGATASTLLEVDEAQDVQIDKFDREILPMAASTNATRVFWGTAWNTQSLLARELREAQDAEERLPPEERLPMEARILPEARLLREKIPPPEKWLQPELEPPAEAALPLEAGGAGLPVGGIQRAFRMDADGVGAEVPAYRAFVEELVARYGRDHPVIRTQYFSEEIDGELGLFSPEVVALMQGSHPPQEGPTPGKIYALLVDVAGEDEHAQQLALFDLKPEMLANPGRDSTALTVIEVDLSTRSDPLVRAPTYRVVYRRLWTGVRHTGLHSEIGALMRHWHGERIVVDATGVGEGAASWLAYSFPGQVIPYKFTSERKSELGWGFRDVIVKNGRWKEPLFRPGQPAVEKEHMQPSACWANQEQWQQLFFRQLRHCQMLSVKGPEMRLRWGVPDGTRDMQSGERVHDDLVISAALCFALEKVEWKAPSAAAPLVVPGADPLKTMTGF